MLDTLGLKARKGFRYSLNDISPKIDTFEEQVQLAHQSDAVSMSLYQKKILELDKKLRRYLVLRDSFTVPPLRMESLKDDIAFEQARRDRYANVAMPLLVPPVSNTATAGQGEAKQDEWQPYSYAEFDDQARRIIGQTPSSNTTALSKIFGAYASGDANAFNAGVADYRESLEKNRPNHWSAVRTDFEAWYNHFSPFFYSMILYMFAFVLVLFAWLGWSLGLTKPLNRAALGLILFVLVVHTFGLIARMYISGRPPVTNLYSSAIFIGWGTVIFGIFLEFFFRKQLPGIGNMLAAATGFLTLLVAFLLTTAVPSFKGDTFTVLVAVLDTQFWLATHVTCVTLGYSATFVAGFLGLVYVFAGLCTPLLTAQASKTLARMIYGVICFALFFSFFGTVLGGLWADDSWGRFWGWDPKENGALIIVLWNALILHARWDGMVKDRGLAVLAIGGNVATSWSWFGVNELGIGLHSYGFTEGVLMILGVFVATQLFIFVAAGLIPKRYWFSSIAAEE